MNKIKELFSLLFFLSFLLLLCIIASYKIYPLLQAYYQTSLNLTKINYPLPPHLTPPQPLLPSQINYQKKEKDYFLQIDSSQKLELQAFENSTINLFAPTEVNESSFINTIINIRGMNTIFKNTIFRNVKMVVQPNSIVRLQNIHWQDNTNNFSIFIDDHSQLRINNSIIEKNQSSPLIKLRGLSEIHLKNSIIRENQGILIENESFYKKNLSGQEELHSPQLFIQGNLFQNQKGTLFQLTQIHGPGSYFKENIFQNTSPTPSNLLKLKNSPHSYLLWQNNKIENEKIIIEDSSEIIFWNNIFPKFSNPPAIILKKSTLITFQYNNFSLPRSLFLSADPGTQIEWVLNNEKE